MPTQTEDFNRGRKAALLGITAHALGITSPADLDVPQVRTILLMATPRPSMRRMTAHWSEASDETWDAAKGVLAAMAFLSR